MFRMLTTAALVCALSLAALAGTAEDAKTRAEAMRSAMKGSDPAAKKAAVEACGGAPHAMTALALMPALTGETDDLRIAAAQALGKMKNLPEAAKVLAAGVAPNGKKPLVLEAIFKAVQGVRHDASFSSCRSFALSAIATQDDAYAPSLKAAIDALAIFRTRDTVEVLITIRAKGAALPRTILALRDTTESATTAALEKLTGESIGDVESFEKWWKRNAYTYNDDMTKRPRVIRRSPDDQPRR